MAARRTRQGLVSLRDETQGLCHRRSLAKTVKKIRPCQRRPVEIGEDSGGAGCQGNGDPLATLAQIFSMRSPLQIHTGSLYGSHLGMALNTHSNLSADAETTPWIRGPRWGSTAARSDDGEVRSRPLGRSLRVAPVSTGKASSGGQAVVQAGQER